MAGVAWSAAGFAAATSSVHAWRSGPDGCQTCSSVCRLCLFFPTGLCTKAMCAWRLARGSKRFVYLPAMMSRRRSVHRYAPRQRARATAGLGGAATGVPSTLVQTAVEDADHGWRVISIAKMRSTTAGIRCFPSPPTLRPSTSAGSIAETDGNNLLRQVRYPTWDRRQTALQIR